MSWMNETMNRVKGVRSRWQSRKRLKKYLENPLPWSTGYEDYKWKQISSILGDQKILSLFSKREPLPNEFGKGIDERIVEYPFVFSMLSSASAKLLDAGSTFNFPAIISHPILVKKDVTIFTAFPEATIFSKDKVNYEYGDLRKQPFVSQYFDEIVCISTLEHIGMDNSIYGEQNENSNRNNIDDQSYLEVIDEFIRVLKPGGSLYITVPFGRKINYGYFQQFDSGMVEAVRKRLGTTGKSTVTFFKYENSGWQFSNEKACMNEEAFNPHTGQGRGTDGAAHSRAISAVYFHKAK